MDSGSSKVEGAYKNWGWWAILVTGLSLATWFFFYEESMTLTPPETTVVVGCWAIVVFLCKMIAERVRKKKSPRK